MSKKPNILFIFTDDQRFDTVSALGNDEVITPNLDKLVKRGITFTHAHIPGGTAPAVCMPSRAMLNTGRSLFHLNDCGQSIPEKHTTIGEAFRSNGYFCYGAGKWHNGSESYQRSFDDGAELYFGGPMDHWNIPVFNYDPEGKYDQTMPLVKEPYKSNEVTERPGDHVTCGKHSTDNIADASISFIDNYDSENPFYMYVSFLAPHDPRTMPKKYLDMYKDRKVSLPDNFTGGHPFDNGELYVRDEQLAPFPREQEDTVRQIKEYYAMITHVDDRIGDLVKALERKGIMEDTIIVFAADNGLAVGRHGLFGKQNLYEHSIRVPLIFSGPGIPENVRTNSYVYLLDIFPTLCELAGIDIPESVEGESFRKVFADPDQQCREQLYLVYKDCQRGVKDKQFKLVEYVVNGQNTMTQLFDFVNDPSELKNLAFDPAYRGKVEELRGSLMKFKEDWNDPAHTRGKIYWDGFPNKSEYLKSLTD